MSHCSWFVSWNSSMMAYVYCACSLFLSEDSPIFCPRMARWTDRIMSLKDWHFISIFLFCHSSKMMGACVTKKSLSRCLLIEPSNSFNVLNAINAS